MNYQELANADVSAAMSEHNVIDSVKGWPIHDRKAYSQAQSLDFEVAILNVTGELNVGNIIRTASLCGARRVHILGRRKYDKRGSVGASNYIDVRRVDLMEDEENLDLDAVSDYFSIKNLFPVFVEQTHRSLGLNQAALEYFQRAAQDANADPCFVFGNEGRGIPEDLTRGSVALQLNQRGVMRSHNVGSTAAIVLYAAMEFYSHV